MRKTAQVIVGLIGLAGLAAVAGAGEITLAAGASLKDSLNAMADQYCREHPGTTIARNYGGSGALAKQIENGLPADLFISANAEWMDYLAARRIVEASGTTVLAKNELVFVTSAADAVKRLEDLAVLSRIAIGSPKSVPAGEYALQVLQEAGLAEALKSKLIYAKDVREALLYAERNEVDGAFVYRTDALLCRHAKIGFTVPRALYPEVVYPAGLTTAGRENAEARAFFAYLQSPAGRGIFAQYGFALP